jgi:hypothetical protein
MLAAMDVVNRLKQLKINALHIKLRGRGGIEWYNCKVIIQKLQVQVHKQL